MVPFLKRIYYFLVVFICRSWDGQHDVCEVVRLTWIHFNQDAAFSADEVTLFRFVLIVDKLTVPVYDIVLILLTELMRSVNLVFDDLGA